MSILDVFKKKESEKKPAKKKEQPAAVVKKEDKKAVKGETPEVKRQTVVTADGRLVETTKKAETKSKKPKQKKEETGDAYKILMFPLVSEKGSYLGATNQYVFAVAPQANKIEIRKAIRKVYSVDPIKVNVMNIAGKKIRYGRTEGRTKNWKKAIITLAQGQKIEIQEGL
jgi:large subunit ribosomal protein L23